MGDVTCATYHVNGSPVRNRGFQPQIIGDLRVDFGGFPGQTYGGASGVLTDRMVGDLCRGSDCVCDARDGCSEGSDQTGEAEDYSDPKCSV